MKSTMIWWQQKHKVYRTQAVIPTCIVSVSRTPVDELLTSEHSSPNSRSLDEQQ